MSGRSRRRSVNGSRPAISTRPALGRAMPSSSSIVEVLPAPFVPSNANSSPGAREMSTPLTASKPVRGWP